MSTEPQSIVNVDKVGSAVRRHLVSAVSLIVILVQHFLFQNNIATIVLVSIVLWGMIAIYTDDIYSKINNSQKQVSSELESHQDVVASQVNSLNEELTSLKDELDSDTVETYKPDRAEMYQRTTQKLDDAQERILVVQRTPTLLVGPRKPGREIERRFKNKLDDIIYDDDDVEVLYAFSMENPEFIEMKQQMGDVVDDRLEDYWETSKKIDSFRFLPRLPSEHNVFPILVVDNAVLLWLNDTSEGGGGDAIQIVDRLNLKIEDSGVADDVFNQFLRFDRNIDDIEG